MLTQKQAKNFEYGAKVYANADEIADTPTHRTYAEAFKFKFSELCYEAGVAAERERIRQQQPATFSVEPIPAHIAAEKARCMNEKPMLTTTMTAPTIGAWPR